MSSGEQQGWEILTSLEPDDACKKACVSFDKATGIYTLKSFRMDINVSIQEKKIFSSFPDSDVLLNRLGYFSKLSILWYLASAKNIPLSGELVRPQNLKGGQLFSRGTHELPLDKIAAKYSNNTEGFITKGKALGGEQLQYGDASLRLFPFPRIPVVLILWSQDDEFPARTDLLFDETCELHLPLDILWSTAMMSLLIMI